MMTGVATSRTPPRKPPEKLTREQKKAVTRGRLLDAAGAVFARQGFAGATLDDVADEAGLTKGAVYSNFASKDELMIALLDTRLEEPLVAIADTVPHQGSTEDQARQADELMTRLYTQEHEALLLGIEFNVYLARNPEVASRFTHRYEARRAAMAAEIERRAAEHGIDLPLGTEELTTGLFALAQGIALERVIAPHHVPEGLFGKLVAVILTPRP